MAELDGATKCDQDPAEAPPIPPGFVLEQVLRKRAVLVDGWCPDETVLLNMSPTLGLERAELERIKTSLESDGCAVMEETEATFESFINPVQEEWRADRLKGAIASSVSSCINLNGDLAVRIGWYKGLLHARSTTLIFQWSGTEWKENTGRTITTVS